MSQPESNESSNKCINWGKWRSLSVIAGLSLVLITQYQNCAPQGEGPEDGAELAINEDPLPVSVINEVKSDAAVSFAAKQVQIHSEAESAVLEGQCSLKQDGSILGWKIHDGVTGQKLEDGFTRCENGRFVVELSPTQELECDHEYRVSAQLGLAKPGEIVIERRCQPEAVADGSHLKAAVAIASDSSSLCVIEKREVRATGCSLVCYSETGVVESEADLEPAQCGL